MQRRHFLTLGTLAIGSYAFAKPLSAPSPVCQAWYLPSSLAGSKNNLTLRVRDTDSALGRYNPHGCIKTVTLDELVKYHGHLCDGIVFSFLQLSVALGALFPDGIIDRTDLQGACKNSPCMVDALAYLTGSRINFKTLRIDPSLGSSHIVQKISTKETYRVQLAQGMFNEELKRAEGFIRAKVAANQTVTPTEIDHVEKLANDFISMMLSTPLQKLVAIEKLEQYRFEPNDSLDLFGQRGDVVNKNVGRN